MPPASARGPFLPGRDARSIQTEEDGTSPRNIFSIRPFLFATAKACPTSSTMLKSRDVAISPSSPIARDVSGTSVATSLPQCRIIIAIFAGRPVSTTSEGPPRSSALARTQPTDPRKGIAFPLESRMCGVGTLRSGRDSEATVFRFVPALPEVGFRSGLSIGSLEMPVEIYHLDAAAL